MFLLRLKLESSTSLQEVASYFVFCFSLCVPLPLFIRSSPLRGERMWGGGWQQPQDKPEERVGLAPPGLACSLCPEQKAEGGWPWRPGLPCLTKQKHGAAEWRGTPGRNVNPQDGK